MSIETVIHRITSDSEFAHAMEKDPLAALEAHGLDLSPQEIGAIKTALKSNNASSLFEGVTNDPTNWFSPQFKSATADPTNWFVEQFHTEID